VGQYGVVSELSDFALQSNCSKRERARKKKQTWKWFVIFFLLGDFPGSECTDVSKQSRHAKIQTPMESPPKEIKQYSQHSKSSKSEYYLSPLQWTPLIRTNTLQIWWSWRHNTQLYYNPHVVLMAFHSVLCLNVTVHLPASFLTSLCPSLFIPVSFHSSFLLFFISHFPFIFRPFCFLYFP